MHTLLISSSNSISTVSLCFVDLSKAFDKMNHYALFLKLIKKPSYTDSWYTCSLAWGLTDMCKMGAVAFLI